MDWHRQLQLSPNSGCLHCRHSFSHDTRFLVFFQDLAKELNRQRRSGSLCDVFLSVDGSQVKAHRAVLSARSSYFNSMFSGDFLEKSQSTIDFSAMFDKVDSLHSLVNYMYTGKLKLSWNNLEEILHAAALFLLEDACKLCSQFMLKNLRLENCLHVWALAEQYSLLQLSKFCQNLACTRFHDYLLYQKEALEVTAQFLKNIASRNSAEVFAQVPYCDFLNFVVRWTKHDPRDRKQELRHILRSREIQTRYPPLKDFVVSKDFEKNSLSATEVELQSRLSGISDGVPSSSGGICAGRSSVTFHAEEEALILQTKFGVSTHKPVLQMYAYTSRTNRWWKFAPVLLDNDHNFDSVIVGFLDNKLVMSRRPEDNDSSQDGSETEICLVDLKNGEIVDLPQSNYVLGLDQTRSYFVFQNTLMVCDFVNNDADDTELFVKTYTPQEAGWAQVFHKILPNIDDNGRHFRFVIETLVQGDRAYICMFHEYSIDQDDHNELLVLDVHLFCVTNDNDKFMVHSLDYERDVRPMDESFADFVCTGASDGVYFTEVSRSDWYLEDSAVAIQGTEISHTDETVKWHTRKLQSSSVPAFDIPLHFHPNYTGLCVLRGSDEKGVLYQVRRISPYISELWKFDVKQRNWMKLKPPPFDSGPLNIDVCRIPLEVLRELEIAQYEYPTEKPQRSPLYIYDLANVRARILGVRGNCVGDTDNEEEEELYDLECRLESGWPEENEPAKCKQVGDFSHIDEDDDDYDESD